MENDTVRRSGGPMLRRTQIQQLDQTLAWTVACAELGLQKGKYPLPLGIRESFGFETV